MNILLLLVLPTLYILLASVSLLQFSVAFSALDAFSVHASHSAALEPVAPILRNFVHYLEACFGPAHKFAPNGTQVLLAAVIVAIVAHGGGGGRR